MNNSKKFKSKLITSKIAYIVFTAIFIYIFTKYIFVNILPFFDKIILIPIYITIIILTLIILIYYLIKNNKFSKKQKEIIYDELDNKIDKVFAKYGLYITENYIICLGSRLNPFRLFVVPIKEIDAIDTNADSRFHYKKRGKKSKHKILSFITASINDDLTFKKDSLAVCNIICDKKVYCITTSSYMNKSKMKEIDEIADYICNKYKNIDYI